MHSAGAAQVACIPQQCCRPQPNQFAACCCKTPRPTQAQMHGSVTVCTRLLSAAFILATAAITNMMSPYTTHAIRSFFPGLQQHHQYLVPVQALFPVLLIHRDSIGSHYRAHFGARRLYAISNQCYYGCMPHHRTSGTSAALSAVGDLHNQTKTPLMQGVPCPARCTRPLRCSTGAGLETLNMCQSSHPVKHLTQSGRGPHFSAPHRPTPGSLGPGRHQPHSSRWGPPTGGTTSLLLWSLR